jgi:hypothetical protein
MAMNTSSTKLTQLLRMICIPLTVVLVLSWSAEDVQSKENESEKQLVFLGADKRLQKDAKQFVMMYESVFGADCRKPKVTERQITEQPERPGESEWVEKWTVDRCGEDFYYLITFTPTPSKGGTDISVAPPESGEN